MFELLIESQTQIIYADDDVTDEGQEGIRAGYRLGDTRRDSERERLGWYGLVERVGFQGGCSKWRWRAGGQEEDRWRIVEDSKEDARNGVSTRSLHVSSALAIAAGIPVDFEPFFFSEVNPTLSAPLEDVAGSITRNGICLKGILSTPDYSHTGELQTLNMKLRNELDLYANVVHVKSLPGIKCRHQNVDAIIIREQTEGEYSALEHECVPGVVECLKIVTRQKSKRIAKFAFDYATKNNRKKVTAVHKANIMKLGDGLFLKSCQEVSVTQREKHPIHSQGARHTFSEAVGKNVANPTAMLLCGAKMLNHVNLQYYGDMIRNAINRVLKAGKVNITTLCS
uniref:(California timema) hypothetical protein n=1 Tax=Timema californicum TaxID=61474 RepID=A0A7R9P8F0_TIMCA|nr:unnamed protein product [Timema californicum]